MKSKRITLKLGILEEQALEAAEARGISIYQFIRNALADALETQAPVIKSGRPRKKKTELGKHEQTNIKTNRKANVSIENRYLSIENRYLLMQQALINIMIWANHDCLSSETRKKAMEDIARECARGLHE